MYCDLDSREQIAMCCRPQLNQSSVPRLPANRGGRTQVLCPVIWKGRNWLALYSWEGKRVRHGDTPHGRERAHRLKCRSIGPYSNQPKRIKEGVLTALIIRFGQQKFCYHQWITVWIERRGVRRLSAFGGDGLLTAKRNTNGFRRWALQA